MKKKKRETWSGSTSGSGKRKRDKETKFDHEGISPLTYKYYLQRYSLFSRYDQGIRMDEEAWFSVTPEEIAVEQADRCGGGLVIDAFSGVGGNAIQFATLCNFVVAIDIDPQKVKMALNNSKLYEVEDYIDFIVGDFFQLAPFLKGDVVFLSPPWGGPSYKSIEFFSLDLLKPRDGGGTSKSTSFHMIDGSNIGYSIFQAAQSITPNVVMFLPRNVNLHQVEELSWLSSPPLGIKIEENYVEGNFKGITVYFGDLVNRQVLQT